MSHEIFQKYFIEYLFVCSTHGFDIELYDILYSILCKLYILRIDVLDWHIHCARVWYEIIKIVEHSLDFHLGSCKRFDEVENVSGLFLFCFFYWYRILKSLISTQIGHFRTVSPVWIHRWLWNDTYSLEKHRRKCPIVFQGYPSNSRSQG